VKPWIQFPEPKEERERANKREESKGESSKREYVV
jgi:hypothetical protein